MEEETEIPCDIRIGRDGTWYFRGMEMLRRDIVNHFYAHLRQEETGRYVIELDNDRAYIEVEDAPFVVKAVYRGTEIGQEPADGYILVLSDDTTEPLAPETIRIAADNVPYCRVKQGRFEARFSPAAYYQLAGYLDYDEDRHAFYLLANGRRRYLPMCAAPAEAAERSHA